MVAASIEVVGAMANLVTIAVAVPQVREMLQRTFRWASRYHEFKDDADEVVVTIRFSSGVTKTLPPNPDHAQLEALAKEVSENEDTNTACR
jgi:hypothetical protein